MLHTDLELLGLEPDEASDFIYFIEKMATLALPPDLYADAATPGQLVTLLQKLNN